MMPTARVLANVVDQFDDIDMADRDTKGVFTKALDKNAKVM